ncbi:MAG: glycerol kinase GlpK [Pseudomonadota bacterium]
MGHILAIDQGTTSTRAIVFDASLKPLGFSQMGISQSYPHSGWVEEDPFEILETTIQTCRDSLVHADIEATEIAAIGLTNQRETTIVWEKETGKPVAPAIVWQDRRTAETCARLKADGTEEMVSRRTGLLLDPYFSATKLAWILDTVPGARRRAENGELLFGTVDTWLIWHLSDGNAHVTDATNAARTMLMDIHQGVWDPELCALFDVPMAMLPEIKNCADHIATTEVLGMQTPILGVAGDQQAATIGQACFKPGMLKSTYGTGCFALLNTGANAVPSQNRLLTTIAYQLDGQRTYALEGSIFIAGAVVQWLRDAMGLIADAEQSQTLAEQADLEQELTIVPAFTGLGAPYWDADCRGAVFGLTRNSGPAEFARAALESVGFQTRDLLEAMRRDGAAGETVLRVDGGMTASDWTMQFLSDILQAPVDRPVVPETTALGAAWLAGMQAGICPDQDGFAEAWSRDRRFKPEIGKEDADHRYSVWQEAVKRTLTNRSE